jgi:hypothetical protein
MSRDHVVSLRVTEAEMEQLRQMGGPTAALRRLLGRNAADPLPMQRVIPITTNGLAPSPVFIQWNNGAIGANYPAVMTG